MGRRRPRRRRGRRRRRGGRRGAARGKWWPRRRARLRPARIRRRPAAGARGTELRRAGGLGSRARGRRPGGGPKGGGRQACPHPRRSQQSVGQVGGRAHAATALAAWRSQRERGAGEPGTGRHPMAMARPSVGMREVHQKQGHTGARHLTEILRAGRRGGVKLPRREGGGACALKASPLSIRDSPATGILLGIMIGAGWPTETMTRNFRENLGQTAVGTASTGVTIPLPAVQTIAAGWRVTTGLNGQNIGTGAGFSRMPSGEAGMKTLGSGTTAAKLRRRARQLRLAVDHDQARARGSPAPPRTAPCPGQRLSEAQNQCPRGPRK